MTDNSWIKEYQNNVRKIETQVGYAYTLTTHSKAEHGTGTAAIVWGLAEMIHRKLTTTIEVTPIIVA